MFPVRNHHITICPKNRRDVLDARSHDEWVGRCGPPADKKNQTTDCRTLQLVKCLQAPVTVCEKTLAESADACMGEGGFRRGRSLSAFFLVKFLEREKKYVHSNRKMVIKSRSKASNRLSGATSMHNSRCGTVETKCKRKNGKLEKKPAVSNTIRA